MYSWTDWVCSRLGLDWVLNRLFAKPRPETSYNVDKKPWHVYARVGWVFVTCPDNSWKTFLIWRLWIGCFSHRRTELVHDLACLVPFGTADLDRSCRACQQNKEDAFALIRHHHQRHPSFSYCLNIMDDTFQFIIESPQHSQGHKKRPRLVTSCDNWYACTRFSPPFSKPFFQQSSQEDQVSTTFSWNKMWSLQSCQNSLSVPG